MASREGASLALLRLGSLIEWLNAMEECFNEFFFGLLQASTQSKAYGPMQPSQSVTKTIPVPVYLVEWVYCRVLTKKQGSGLIPG